MKGVKILAIDTTSFEGKLLLVGELLVQLKGRADLKYKEIAELELFTEWKFSSPGAI